jgi:hypothetical protein
LVTRVDHNGKVFTDQVRKQKVASIIQTTTSRIRGVLFYEVDGRLKDNLNDRAEDFIAVAEAEFLSQSGEVIGRTDFIAVNKRHIEWVMPADAVTATPGSPGQPNKAN